MSAPGDPRFDLPRFTRPGAATLAEAGVDLAEQPALPPLADPVTPPLEHAENEPLVPIAHRRIRVLDNYWHAGWATARPGALLRRSAAASLYRAVESLPDRWGFAVFDAFRPLALQSELWHAAQDHPDLPEGLFADPVTDPTAPPPHLTGGTVDLTLTLDGTPLELGTGFDDVTDLAWTDAFEAVPGPERALRRLLYWSMAGAGFVVLRCEWWHFEYGTRRWGAIRGARPRYGSATPPA
jgi:D-alanyl-D-alanine dipeptidase